MTDEDGEATLPRPRPDDLVRLHQGLVLLAAALLMASALGSVAALSDALSIRDEVAQSDVVPWLARLLTGALAWLVPCPVLVGVPRLLRLPEAPRESGWASGVLWGTALLGVLVALVEVVGLALAFMPSGRLAMADRGVIAGSALVAVAVAALALNAAGRSPRYA